MRRSGSERGAGASPPNQSIARSAGERDGDTVGDRARGKGWGSGGVAAALDEKLKLQQADIINAQEQVKLANDNLRGESVAIAFLALEPDNFPSFQMPCSTRPLAKM